MTIPQSLLLKSIECITLAIELYNKPLIKYRSESVVILIINSWENLLKAFIKKENLAKIYNKKKDESKPFSECLECVKSNLGNTYSDDWYHSTKLLYEKRCKISHYNKDLETIDYMIIQSNIILFKEFLQKYFNKTIIKDKNWYILPIGSELPYTEFDFIKNTSALRKTNPQIKSYIEKIIEIHSTQIESGLNKGILVNIKVTLENINRIKNADLVVGVKNDGGHEMISLGSSLKLSDEGRGVKINEITEALKKYQFHHKDVSSTARKMEGHTRAKYNKFMRGIRENRKISFNWGTFSTIFPMSIRDKYTYAAEIIDEYKKYLLKE